MESFALFIFQLVHCWRVLPCFVYIPACSLMGSFALFFLYSSLFTDGEFCPVYIPACSLLESFALFIFQLVH
jgi:hypothetical protein